RAPFVKRRKEGKRFFKEREGGKKKLTHEEYDDDKLLMPEDLFYPMQRYTKLFGDPRSKENKDKGHKVSEKYGTIGVVVPGDDGIMPFRIQRSRGSKIRKEEELANADDPEFDEANLEEQFQSLRDQRDEDHASTATGMLHAVLLGFKDDSVEPSKKAVAEAPVQRKKKQPKKNPQAGDGDDADEEEAPVLSRRLAREVSDPDALTRGKVPKPASAAKPSAARGSGSRPSSAPSRVTPDKKIQGAVTGGNVPEQSGPRSVGRPALCPKALLLEVRSDFIQASSVSTYFGDQHLVKIRQLGRASAKAQEKALVSGQSKEEVAEWELTGKLLQVVSSVIKLYKAWSVKKDGAGARQFISSWMQLDAFVKADPPGGSDLFPLLVKQAHADVRVQYHFADKDTVALLTQQSLVNELGVPESHAIKKQEEYVYLGFFGILTNGQLDVDAAGDLVGDAATMLTYASQSMPKSFQPAIIQQVLCARPSNFTQLENAYASGTKCDAPRIAGLLGSARLHGEPLLRKAKARMDKLEATQKVTLRVEKAVEDIKAHTSASKDPAEWSNIASCLKELISHFFGLTQDLRADAGKLDFPGHALTCTVTLVANVAGKWVNHLADAEEADWATPWKLTTDNEIKTLRKIGEKLSAPQPVFETLDFLQSRSANAKWLGDLLAGRDVERDALAALQKIADKENFTGLFMRGTSFPVSSDKARELEKKLAVIQSSIAKLSAKANTSLITGLGDKVRSVIAMETDVEAVHELIEPVLEGLGELIESLSGSGAVQLVATRADGAGRFIRTKHMIAKVRSGSWDFGDVAHGENVANLAKEVVGLGHWLENQPTLAFGDAIEGFHGFDLVAICKGASDMGGQIAQAAWQQGLSAAQLLIDDVNRVCPKESFVENKAMLNPDDPSIRHLLMNNPLTKEIAPLVSTMKNARGILAKVHKAHPVGFKVSELDEALRAASVRCRRFLGVKHCLDKLFNDVPKMGKEKLQTFFKRTMGELRHHGYTVPLFLEKTMAKLSDIANGRKPEESDRDEDPKEEDVDKTDGSGAAPEPGIAGQAEVGGHEVEPSDHATDGGQERIGDQAKVGGHEVVNSSEPATNDGQEKIDDQAKVDGHKVNSSEQAKESDQAPKDGHKVKSSDQATGEVNSSDHATNGGQVGIGDQAKVDGHKVSSSDHATNGGQEGVGDQAKVDGHKVSSSDHATNGGQEGVGDQAKVDGLEVVNSSEPATKGGQERIDDQAKVDGDKVNSSEPATNGGQEGVGGQAPKDGDKVNSSEQATNGGQVGIDDQTKVDGHKVNSSDAATNGGQVGDDGHKVNSSEPATNGGQEGIGDKAPKDGDKVNSSGQAKGAEKRQ
ncbi:unnamed protein product, partial [Prorocentrum cordatum]